MSTKSAVKQRVAALLIAHGSRRDEANADLVRIADEVRGRGLFSIVEIAYLELASPSIEEGARRCVEAGATHVRMLPYFLSAGAHVVEDLERHRCELALRWQPVEFTLCQPLSGHPLLIQIVLDRLQSAEKS